MKQLEREKKKIEEKKQLEIEQKKKRFEEEQLKAEQKITELEYEKLQQDLVYKTKELSNSMINILHKNEIFLEFKTEMEKLFMEKNIAKRDKSIQKLIRTIDSEISSKRDLELFDLNFSAVHEDFIKKLKEKFPNLNQNDLRLCTFLKMNKTTKEIATLMNMSVRGVETSRYRLRKKMGLDRDGNLYDIISET
jgi:DNA-binding CsgD family transcriptional regulator